MAVLVEGISVLVRCDSIHKKYRGGWDQFMTNVPNKTFCEDYEIARIGFMSPVDAEDFIKRLEGMGLTFLEDNKAIDIVVAYQEQGLTASCDWAEFDKIDYTGIGSNVSVCRMVGTKGKTLITPDGWDYENSLSKSSGFALRE